MKLAVLYWPSPQQQSKIWLFQMLIDYETFNFSIFSKCPCKKNIYKFLNFFLVLVWSDYNWNSKLKGDEIREIFLFLFLFVVWDEERQERPPWDLERVSKIGSAIICTYMLHVPIFVLCTCPPLAEILKPPLREA